MDNYNNKGKDPNQLDGQSAEHLANTNFNNNQNLSAENQTENLKSKDQSDQTQNFNSIQNQSNHQFDESNNQKLNDQELNHNVNNNSSDSGQDFNQDFQNSQNSQSSQSSEVPKGHEQSSQEQKPKENLNNFSELNQLETKDMIETPQNKTDKKYQKNKPNREAELRKTIKLTSSILLIAGILFVGNLALKGLNNLRGNSEIMILSTTVNDQNLNLEVADNPEKRKIGLSGRRMLPAGQGFLMIFTKLDKHGIWMKDMQFPIDVVWLGQDFRVVDFKEEILPETFPKVFYPKTDSLYVIELPAGAIEKYSLTLGQKIELPIDKNITN